MGEEVMEKIRENLYRRPNGRYSTYYKSPMTLGLYPMNTDS